MTVTYIYYYSVSHFVDHSLDHVLLIIRDVCDLPLTFVLDIYDMAGETMLSIELFYHIQSPNRLLICFL